MDTPVFTIIITTYNRKDILPRAINSVLGQSFPHFELIVVDNGSTDGTKDIVSAISDKRVMYTANPRPSDSCDAPRNLGIKMAHGRYTAFLDDDDIWYSNRLEMVNNAFGRNPGVSAVCHEEYRVLDGNIIERIQYDPSTDNIYETLLYDKNCLSPCATTVKTDDLRKLGGFDLRKEFSGAADYELWIRMAGEGKKVFFINEPLGEFTMTGQNYSIKDPSYGAKVASIVEMHILNHEKRDIFSISKRGMWRLLRLNVTAGRYYCKAKQYRRAVKHYLKALLFIARRPSLINDLISRIKDGNRVFAHI